MSPDGLRSRRVLSGVGGPFDPIRGLVFYLHDAREQRAVRLAARITSRAIEHPASGVNRGAGSSGGARCARVDSRRYRPNCTGNAL